MKRRPFLPREDSGRIMLQTAAMLSLSAALILVGGCRRPAQERKYDAVAGVATEIDLDTGDVSMDWRNAETGGVRRLTGRVTQETEILINGIGADLADARLGDRVTVVVYHLLDEPTRSIVTQVQIERPEQFVRDPPVPADSTAAEESNGSK